MRIYEYDEWDLIPGEDYTPDTNTYVDLEGNPITGILKDFYFYKTDDPRNNQYVENGKRP